MAKYQNPLVDKEYGDYTYCEHCETAHQTEKWVENDWDCPHPECDGSIFDAQPWEEILELKPEFPDVPVEGNVYTKTK